MKIEKSISEPGWFFAEQRIDGDFFIGAGKTIPDAIERCVEKIIWIHGEMVFEKRVCPHGICDGSGWIATDVMTPECHWESGTGYPARCLCNLKEEIDMDDDS